MRTTFGLIGATIGGWLGWALGGPAGLFAAFMISMLGTGVGMYIGYRMAARLL